METNHIILETKDLCKSFGALRAVDLVNLQVAGGRVHSIIGPNGAGKTTLFNLLTGFLPITHGKIFFNGTEITNLPPHRISKMGIARSFQITSIFPDLTIHENIRIAIQSRTKSNYNFLTHFKNLKGVGERLGQVLEEVGLAQKADAVAKNLSYGERRAVDIGIALATEPNLLLLDEPTSGMSEEESSRIIGLIKEISARLTVVLIEHNIDVVLSISDVVTVMHQGQVIAEGRPEEIQENQKVQEAYLGGY
ncbi:MAG: ABC transporter ATP-binding protein [Desulfobacterales bacterium]|nr:ABC transporter ATP-binding protein [Desulfobacterales bacterium]